MENPGEKYIYMHTNVNESLVKEQSVEKDLFLQQGVLDFRIQELASGQDF